METTFLEEATDSSQKCRQAQHLHQRSVVEKLAFIYLRIIPSRIWKNISSVNSCLHDASGSGFSWNGTCQFFRSVQESWGSNVRAAESSHLLSDRKKQKFPSNVGSKQTQFSRLAQFVSTNRTPCISGGAFVSSRFFPVSAPGPGPHKTTSSQQKSSLKGSICSQWKRTADAVRRRFHSICCWWSLKKIWSLRSTAVANRWGESWSSARSQTQ